MRRLSEVGRDDPTPVHTFTLMVTLSISYFAWVDNKVFKNRVKALEVELAELYAKQKNINNLLQMKKESDRQTKQLMEEVHWEDGGSTVVDYITGFLFLAC
jgi:hypothetical protein